MSVPPTSPEEIARFEAPGGLYPPGDDAMSHGLVRVMMVEDDPDIRAVAHLSLTAVGGFSVELCPSGAEALARAAAFSPQLILLDVMMPGMDGPTTLAKLRELPAMETVPIVFMTAKARPEEIQDYLRLGAADVVAKPFDPMTLPAALHAVWERHHA